MKDQKATPKHILLCGFMAAGKSSIGRVLARELHMPFYDLDKTIEQEENRIISDIFSEHGEAHFRELELHYLDQLLTSPKSVIALGGGALQSEEVVNRIKKDNLLVYLNPPIELIIKRLARNKTRPLLFNPDGTKRDKKELKAYLNELHKKRESLYLQAHICMKIEPTWNRYTIAKKVVRHAREHGDLS